MEVKEELYVKEISDLAKSELLLAKPPEAFIKQLNVFKKLNINGLEDKAGAKKLREKRLLIRTHRLKVSKVQKDMKDKAKSDAKTICEMIDEYANPILELMVPVENLLKEREDAYTAAVKEQKRLAAELFEMRSKKISELGVLFDGKTFSLGAVRVKALTVKKMDASEFELLILRIENEVQALRKALGIEEPEETEEIENKPKSENGQQSTEPDPPKSETVTKMDIVWIAFNKKEMKQTVTSFQALVKTLKVVMKDKTISNISIKIYESSNIA